MGNVSLQYERRDLWRPEAWRRGRGTGILAAGAAADCVADASERQMNTKQRTTTTTTTTTASQPLFPSLIHLFSTSPNLRFNRRILLLITYQHPHPSITRVDHAHPIISTTPPIFLSRLATKPTFETLLHLLICLALSPLWDWRYFSDCG